MAGVQTQVRGCRLAEVGDLDVHLGVQQQVLGLRANSRATPISGCTNWLRLYRWAARCASWEARLWLPRLRLPYAQIDFPLPALVAAVGVLAAFAVKLKDVIANLIDKAGTAPGTWHLAVRQVPGAVPALSIKLAITSLSLTGKAARTPTAATSAGRGKSICA
jgi:hypothetical protein